MRSILSHHNATGHTLPVVARAEAHLVGATWCMHFDGSANPFARTYKRPTRPPELEHT